MPDSDAEKVNLEPESISLMETLMAGERDPVGLQNGFSPATNDMDQAGGTEAERKETTTPPEHICPVGLHKGVLLYPPSAHSNTCSPPSRILYLTVMILCAFNQNQFF